MIGKGANPLITNPSGTTGIGDQKEGGGTINLISNAREIGIGMSGRDIQKTIIGETVSKAGINREGIRMIMDFGKISLISRANDTRGCGMPGEIANGQHRTGGEDKTILTVTSRIKEALTGTTSGFPLTRATGSFPPTAIIAGFLLITSGFLLTGAGRANRRVSGIRGRGVMTELEIPTDIVKPSCPVGTIMIPLQQDKIGIDKGLRGYGVVMYAIA